MNLLVNFIFSAVIGIIYSSRSLNTGNDTEQYYIYFKRYKNFINPNISEYEPFYHFLITYSPSFKFYLFLVAFLTFFFISNIYEIKKNWITSFLLLLFLGFFNVATDQSRQILAISFVAFFLEKFNYKRSIIVFIIGSLIHISCLVIYPVFYFLNKVEKKENNLPLFLYFIILITALIFGFKKIWMELLLKFLSVYMPDSVYLGERFYYSLGSNEGLGLMMYRFGFALILLVFFNSKKFSRGFNILFIGLIIQVSSAGFMPIERIGNSFFFIGIISIANKELSLIKYNYKVVIVLFYTLIYFIQTNIFNVEKHGSVPWI